MRLCLTFAFHPFLLAIWSNEDALGKLGDELHLCVSDVETRQGASSGTRLGMKCRTSSQGVKRVMMVSVDGDDGSC